MRSRGEKEEETKGESKQEENKSEEKKSRFSAHIGALVVRNIEGIWFQAIVESIDVRRQTCTIKYLDDDNLETVLMEELREADEKPSSRVDVHHANDTVIQTRKKVQLSIFSEKHKPNSN